MLSADRIAAILLYWEVKCPRNTEPNITAIVTSSLLWEELTFKSRNSCRKYNRNPAREMEKPRCWKKPPEPKSKEKQNVSFTSYHSVSPPSTTQILFQAMAAPCRHILNERTASFSVRFVASSASVCLAVYLGLCAECSREPGRYDSPPANYVTRG